MAIAALAAVEGIGPNLPLPGMPPPAAEGSVAPVSVTDGFPAAFPLAALAAGAPLPGTPPAPGAGERGKASPSGGKPLPLEPAASAWVPPMVPLVPVALPPPGAAAGALPPDADPTAPAIGGATPARPGRGPEVAVLVRGGALPAQVLERLAQKSGPPGQLPPEEAPDGPPLPAAQSRPLATNWPAEPPPSIPGPPRPPSGDIPIDDPVTEPMVRPATREGPASTTSVRPAEQPLPAVRPDAMTDATGAPGTERTAPPPSPVPAALAEAMAEPAHESAEARPAQQGSAVAFTAVSAPREPGPSTVMQLAVPAGTERFPDALGERVAWMIDRDLGSAQLRLNPPQLGPVEVRVQVSGDQASVALAAHTQQAREALEQAMPRLRDMLGSQGFVQVNVNVSQHSFSERPSRSEPWELPALSGQALEALAAGPAPSRSRAVAALLDAYA